MPFYLHQLSIGLSSGEWLEHRVEVLLKNIHLIETVFDLAQAERVLASAGRRAEAARFGEEASPERGRKGRREVTRGSRSEHFNGLIDNLVPI
ncbi:MAG: hypothetical protein JJE16_11030 [Nitrospiraceae bacterium]|nr:hypothetical protein [Nitrospiraceae bacterium]